MKFSIQTTLHFSFVLVLLCVRTLSTTTTHVLLIPLLSIFIACLLSYWLIPGGFAWRNYHNDPKKLNGPIGWPVFGTLPQMGPLAHRKLADAAARMGATRLMAFSLGTVPMIISSHPDTAREILIGPSFSDRPVKISARLLMFERAIGFAPSGGTYWRQLRRIAAVHMFSPRKISDLEPVRQRIAREMVEKVRSEMAAGTTKRVVLREVLQKGSLDNVLESVFGNVGLEVREELGLMVKEGFELIAKFNVEDYFPAVRFLDVYGVKRRCFKLAGKVNEVVGRVVGERKKESMIKGPTSSDFLSALLCLPEQERLQESDLVPILWEMVFRGTDTVAILLEWIMARMALHPEIQRKAQQELDDLVARETQVVLQDSDIQNLPYLQGIVKETLRLHPPGPLLSWARLAIHDVHVDKTLIPAGTTAMVNMWAITHDPSIWTDPWEFKPERFIENDVSIMGSDLRLAPFGSGRRVCPGKALGLATVQLWLARFLQRFDWLPAEPVDLSEHLGMTMEMKRPLTCYAVERRVM